MKTIKEILVENLINLRKSHKLTQLELSEKVGYSDKAISRWEHGEVLPDITTLERLAEIYGVSFTSLFEENLNIQKEKNRNSQSTNKILISLLSIFSVWVMIIICYIVFKLTIKESIWELFVVGVPLSFLLATIFTSVWSKKRYAFLCGSFLLWTILATIFFTLLKYNLWMVFILGAPIQVILILCMGFKSSNK